MPQHTTVTQEGSKGAADYHIALNFWPTSSTKVTGQTGILEFPLLFPTREKDAKQKKLRRKKSDIWKMTWFKCCLWI